MTTDPLIITPGGMSARQRRHLTGLRVALNRDEAWLYAYAAEAHIDLAVATTAQASLLITLLTAQRNGTPIALCPTCSGRRLNRVHRSYNDGTGEYVTIACETCAGCGTIGLDAAQRIEEGRALKRARIARRESLAQAAKARGLTVLQYAMLELGREVPA